MYLTLKEHLNKLFGSKYVNFEMFDIDMKYNLLNWII